MDDPENPSLPPQDKPGLPRFEVHGRVFSPMELAVYGAIGTVALSLAANYYDGSEGRPRLPAIDIGWTTSSHHGSDAEKSDKVHSVTTREETEKQTLSSVMTEEWAQEFGVDADAGRLIDPTLVDSLATGLKTETANGWSITAVRTRGTTSAEDDTVDSQGERTAGLQQTSDSAASKQEELGNIRRDEGTIELVAALQERGINIDPSAIELLPSIEDVLSDEEVAVIDGLAGRFGYANTTTMIEQWNRDPDSTPPDVDAALTKMLFLERQFQVEVELSRPVEQQTPKDGEKNPSGEDDSQEHQIRLLPFLLPGYLFISASRRRRPIYPKPGKPGETSAPPAEVSTPPEKPPVFSPRLKRSPSRWQRTREVPVQRIDRRKQPRPYNMHGSRGPNNHVGRTRGGDRRAKRG